MIAEAQVTGYPGSVKQWQPRLRILVRRDYLLDVADSISTGGAIPGNQRAD